MTDDIRLQQVSLLRRARIAPHQRPVEILGSRTDILGDLGGQFQGAREDSRAVRHDLIEQISKVLGSGWKDAARADEVAGVGKADQARQEVGRAGLHDDAAPSKDEPVFAPLVGHSGYVQTRLRR